MGRVDVGGAIGLVKVFGDGGFAGEVGDGGGVGGKRRDRCGGGDGVGHFAGVR